MVDFWRQLARWGLLAALPSCAGLEPGTPPEESVSDVKVRPDYRRVEICHRAGGHRRSKKTWTITVPARAVPAHLRHGDMLGPCTSGCAQSGCDDGNRCTSDTCLGNGRCEHAVVSCDDGNPCTAESCDPAVGCASTPNDVSCDDGNDCTENDACTAGQCAGSAIGDCCSDHGDCQDGNGCTEDRCADHRCTNAPIDCSTADHCVAGFCDPANGSCSSTPVSCDDANACTVDECDPNQGCLASPLPEGTACGAGFSACCGALTPGCRDLSADEENCGACGRTCDVSSSACGPGNPCDCLAGRCECNDDSDCPLPTSCNGSTNRCENRCGDGTVAETEQCDDGNDDTCDGCEACAKLSHLVLTAESFSSIRPAWQVGLSNLTIEAWVLVTASGDLVGVGNTDFARLSVDGQGRPVFAIQLSATTVVSATGPSDLFDGLWHHLAGIRSSLGGVSLFVDGIPVASATLTTAFTSINDDDIWIGHVAALAGASAAARIDEIRISSTARYGATFMPARRHSPDANTIALYHLDEGAGTAVADASTNARDLTLGVAGWGDDDCYGGSFF